MIAINPQGPAPALFPVNFCIKHQGYTLKCGFSAHELERIHRLRAQVFCTELQWVGRTDSTHEIDEFDQGVIPVAIFKGSEVIASLRIHPAHSPWMACTVFKELMPDQPEVVQRADACEVSRLALAQDYRHKLLDDGVAPVEALYQALYAYCRLSRLRYVYMIVALPVLRVLRQRGLPCHPLGQPKRMEDGVIALSARLDWDEFDAINQQRHPERLQRFLQVCAEAVNDVTSVQQPVAA